MRRWIFRNIEAFLAILSLVLLAVIIVLYVIGISSVANSLGTAFNTNTGTQAGSSFDLNAAKKLDVRGLTPNAGNPATQIKTPTSSPPAQ
jgi:hypothetical protein